MASVTFYEDDDCKGNKRTFSGYQAVNDLAEYDYDNSSQEMDDSINSLKTGDNTWICLFSKHNFEGDTVKFGPNQTINNLHDYHDGDGTGFRNTTVSFVMYERQPDFWDVTDTHNTGDCWVKLYTGLRFTANEYCLKGADEVYHTGETINTACINGYRTWVNSGSSAYYSYHYPRSLTTGPNTWVQLFEDISFKNQVSQFGPNSIIPDLSKYGSISINSIKVYNSEPSNWQGTSSTTPNMVLTIEKYQTGQKIESLIAGVLSCIPYVGGLAKGILGALWPSSPSTVEVWNDLDNYMNTLVTGLINQNNLAFLNSTLQGLGNMIDTYSSLVPSDEKANSLQSIIDELDGDKPYFYSVSNPEQNLTYLIEFATMDVLMLAERVYNYSILSAGKSDPNHQVYVDKLNNSISEFTSAVSQAKADAINWRISLITVTEHGSISTEYTLMDAYNGYTAEYSNQSDANAAKTTLENEVQAQYEQLLEAKISPSFLWSYLLTSNTEQVENSGNLNFPTTVFKTLPTEQTVNVTTGTYGDNLGTAFTDSCNGRKITGVKLCTKDNFVSGIQWFFDGVAATLHGNTGSSSITVTFDSDEYITSIYGGSGSYVDQFFIRTNKGRDVGIGGNGGSTYVAAPAQGIDTQITSITGYVGSYVSQMTINWAYTVWK